jgi:hypothetical protein
MAQKVEPGSKEAVDKAREASNKLHSGRAVAYDALTLCQAKIPSSVEGLTIPEINKIRTDRGNECKKAFDAVVNPLINQANQADSLAKGTPPPIK